MLPFPSPQPSPLGRGSHCFRVFARWEHYVRDSSCGNCATSGDVKTFREPQTCQSTRRGNNFSLSLGGEGRGEGARTLETLYSSIQVHREMPHFTI